MSSTMSARRVPLSSNPNAANSPLRGAVGSAAAFAKQKRSHASMQREENYGHPPAKKQMLDAHSAVTSRSVSVSTGLRSPTARRVPTAQRGVSSRAYPADRVSHSHGHRHQEDAQKVSEKEAEAVRRWQQSQRLRFPKLVFYFDSLPEDQTSRLSKHITHLGAREDKFFSINITHIVTTRAIPPEEKPLTKQQQPQPQHHDVDQAHEMSQEHPQTINPSLLSRNTSDSASSKWKVFDNASGRRIPLTPFGAAEDAIRKPKPTRSTDILHRAREMGMKIWSLDKLQRVLDALLEPDLYRGAEPGQRSRATAGSRMAGDQALLQMLDKERQTGPSDRDPTVATRELIYFSGPYIYVYDIEEKQRPIMVREYAKVADKEEGDWPQLRPSGGSRCPFIEDTDQLELRAEKRRARMRKEAASAASVASVATATVAAGGTSLQKTLANRYAAAAAGAKSATRKRTAADMQDGDKAQQGTTPAEGIFGTSTKTRATSNSIAAASAVSATASAAASAASISSSAFSAAAAPGSVPKTSTMEFQNAFTSRAKSARCFAGEPVASGLQAAGVTSAIRSQMISSATGSLGARAGTSKEIHGLQRKVLQKSTAPTSQQDLSSRRLAELNVDQQQNQKSLYDKPQQPHKMQHSYSRSTSLSRSMAAHVGAKLAAAHEDGTLAADDKQKRQISVPVPVQAPRQKKRDPKPGYCENCQSKFHDFEDHIVSHKHRKFAEDNHNWSDLDALLGQLTRSPKYGMEDWP